MSWKFDKNNVSVSRTNEDGTYESVLVSAPEIQKWIAEGNTPELADEVVPDEKAVTIQTLVDLLVTKGVLASNEVAAAVEVAAEVKS